MSKKWYKAKVVAGQGKGKQLGFPTANLLLPPDFKLDYGIYTVHVCSARPLSKGVRSIASQSLRDRRGLRPACGACDPLLTSGLACFHGVLYWGTKGLPAQAGGQGQSLEIHIFDFDGDLYAKELEFQVGRFIREDKNFDSDDELVVQIKDDIKKAKEAL